MKKKFSVFYFFVTFLFCMSTILGLNITKKAWADSVHDDVVACSSKSAILIDANTKTVIYSKNENERLPIASMCKIMTLLLCYESVDQGIISLEDEIIVSENASKMGGSQVFLEANGCYKVTDLLTSIAVASANDSCVAMAEKIAGSEAEFVKMMNNKCHQLSMNNTTFSNCTGLPKPDQYSCAKDVATMFCELIKHKEYFEISNIWMQDFIHPHGRITQMSNTNKLVKFYNGCDSGKTGYTNDAGHCLTASAIRNGLRLVAVEINAPDSKTRFKEVSEMFNYGFANFSSKEILNKNSALDIPVAVEFGKKDVVSIYPEENFYIFSKTKDKKVVEINFIPKEKIIAPVIKGDILGVLEIYEKDALIATINAVAGEDVLEKTYFDIVTDIAKNWPFI